MPSRKGQASGYWAADTQEQLSQSKLVLRTAACLGKPGGFLLDLVAWVSPLEMPTASLSHHYYWVTSRSPTLIQRCSDASCHRVIHPSYLKSSEHGYCACTSYSVPFWANIDVPLSSLAPVRCAMKSLSENHSRGARKRRPRVIKVQPRTN